MVSSWEYFPWMMDVCSLRPWLSTAFQTCAELTTQAEVRHYAASRDPLNEHACKCSPTFPPLSIYCLVMNSCLSRPGGCISERYYKCIKEKVPLILAT